ncbi:hypothetical protein CBOM_07934 [Ceraceosorus bombacis]|uniref:Uncharacterized protein n=1 Tax=Ceraceosorus bombacis TaxID=401625 RepID=A0A0N7LBB7_9BASI|nr:hypothetical protein CBOM_07934 [Ceraceosorus bombacis]
MRDLFGNRSNCMPVTRHTVGVAADRALGWRQADGSSATQSTSSPDRLSRAAATRRWLEVVPLGTQCSLEALSRMTSHWALPMLGTQHPSAIHKSSDYPRHARLEH